MYRVVLASNSPRRKEILQQVGIDFEVIPSQSEEVSSKINPIEKVEELARNKAIEVANTIEGPVIVIGADTIVVHNGTILGKPKDEKDAIAMLSSLQGNNHEVYTGVGIVLKDIVGSNEEVVNEVISFADVSKVIVQAMSREQIEAYVKTKECMDKAGSYAIQGKFAIYIKEIIGDYYNIVGLPISMLYQKLYGLGIDLLK